MEGAFATSRVLLLEANDGRIVGVMLLRHASCFSRTMELMRSGSNPYGVRVLIHALADTKTKCELFAF
jgi:hypothetical protein